MLSIFKAILKKIDKFFDRIAAKLLGISTVNEQVSKIDPIDVLKGIQDNEERVRKHHVDVFYRDMKIIADRYHDNGELEFYRTLIDICNDFIYYAKIGYYNDVPIYASLCMKGMESLIKKHEEEKAKKCE